MLKFIRFTALALPLCVFSLGCEKDSEDNGAEVKIGDGKGVQIDAGGTEVDVGGGNGVQVETED